MRGAFPRYGAGVHDRLPDLEESARKGVVGKKTVKRIHFEGNLCYCFPEDDLAETGETFPGLNLGWDVPKPFFDSDGKRCGIISAQNHFFDCGAKAAG
jgi:hypothetical protein